MGSVLFSRVLSGKSDRRLAADPTESSARSHHSLVDPSATAQATPDEALRFLRLLEAEGYTRSPGSEANRPIPKDKSATASDCCLLGEREVRPNGPCAARS